MRSKCYYGIISKHNGRLNTHHTSHSELRIPKLVILLLLISSFCITNSKFVSAARLNGGSGNELLGGAVADADADAEQG